MRVTIDMLDDKSKDLLWLTYANGAGVVLENTEQPDEILVRAYNHRDQAVVAKAKDVKLLFENGYMHVLNANITASNRLVLIAEQPANSEYKFSNDLSNLQKQHPRVQASIAEQERKWQARNEAERIEREKQRALEEQRKAEEEAFLKTPKGRLVNAARKTKKAFGTGLDAVIDTMDKFSRSADESIVSGAKRRHDNNDYHFGTMGFRRVQKANDEAVLKFYNKK